MGNTTNANASPNAMPNMASFMRSELLTGNLNYQAAAMNLVSVKDLPHVRASRDFLA